jgi:hypothetical protein
MTKMEEVSALIKKYAPIAEGKVDIVLFVLFVATCVLLAKQTIEQKPGQIYLSLIRRKGEAHR